MNVARIFKGGEERSKLKLKPLNSGEEGR